jgi:hypothetical protein
LVRDGTLGVVVMRNCGLPAVRLYFIEVYQNGRRPNNCNPPRPGPGHASAAQLQRWVTGRLRNGQACRRCYSRCRPKAGDERRRVRTHAGKNLSRSGISIEIAVIHELNDSWYTKPCLKCAGGSCGGHPGGTPLGPLHAELPVNGQGVALHEPPDHIQHPLQLGFELGVGGHVV